MSFVARLRSPAKAGFASVGPASQGTEEAVPGHNGSGPLGPAHIEDLWQPKAKANGRHTKREAKRSAGQAGESQHKPLPPASGIGVALDGGNAVRARVVSGQVTSCEVFRSGGGDVLAEALDGTHGAQVVCVDGVLFAPSAELAGEGHPNALAFVEAGKRTWPASNLTAVAGVATGEGRACLVGWEAQGFSWATLEKAGARVLGLPFVLADGAWLVCGSKRSWFALVDKGRPVLCRELKGADFAQLAGQVGMEVARLAKEGRVVGDVQVLGVPLDAQAAAALARVGVHGVQPVVPGVTRWEISWAEQATAGLAALAALARPAPTAWWHSPTELQRLAEAPIKRRRLAILGGGGAVSLGVALAGLLPLVSAHADLSKAQADLSLARANEASVSRWLALRSEVLALGAEARSDRGQDSAYVPALLELELSAPSGTTIGSVDASLSGDDVVLDVTAFVPGGSFVPVALWQQNLARMGATAVVSGESTNRGQVSVTMTVTVPPAKRNLHLPANPYLVPSSSVPLNVPVPSGTFVPPLGLPRPATPGRAHAGRVPARNKRVGPYPVPTTALVLPPGRHRPVAAKKAPTSAKGTAVTARKATTKGARH